MKEFLKKGQMTAIVLTIYDMFVINLAYFIGLWLRYDCRYGAISETYLDLYFSFVPVYTIFCLILFRILKLYNSIWRFVSFSELTRVGVSSIISTIFHVAGMAVLCRLMPDIKVTRMPIFYYVVGAVIQFLLIIGIRFSYRFVLLQRSILKRNSDREYKSRILLIGAGSAGQMILRDLNKAKETKNEVVCGIIDDNKNIWNRYLEGVPIIGGRDSILKAVEEYKIDKIFVAIPSASKADIRDILNICKETGCEIKNMPGMYQFVSGEVTVASMKDVAVEDLLGRDPIKCNTEEILNSLENKTILVTGGGGSIGSELCRQIAGHKPKKLIIFEVYENSAYDIQQELIRKHPDLDLLVLIGSVRDSGRINDVFATYKPDVVYHAAAHKHVPLMETSPREAIKNNVFGTYKTAYAAMKNGCKRFVLISTDKAVNPTNIMGASKRLCEMVIQTFDKLVKENKANMLPILHAHSNDEDGSMKALKKTVINSKTEFVAVRFGNVLGSNGSVIPLFKKQIEAGGPVTVTHPDIIRFFMTIPEAVNLVLEAGAMAAGGEIFVLDMGEPVKIDTLARNLIILSGHKPDVDIKVEYTGLRPGEKLYEERLMEEEGMRTTANELIHIGSPIPFETDEFLKQLQVLMKAAYSKESNIRELVAEIVTTYHPEGIDKNSNQVKDLAFKEAAATDTGESA